MTTTIYLDSSDFSNMASSKNQYWVDAKKKLLDQIHNNAIEVRFSIFHVIEITHVDEIYKNYAVERAKVISEICNGKCMYSWQELIIREIENKFRKNKKTPRDISCRDDGIWAPIVRDPAGIVAQEFAKSLQDIHRQIENDINNNAKPRAERRRQAHFWRKQFDEAIKSRKGAIWARIVSNYGCVENEILCKKIGIYDANRGYQLMRGWLEGSVSNKELENEIFNAMMDVVGFVDYFYEKTDNAAVYFESMRNVGNVIFEEINNVRVAIAQFSSKYGADETEKYVNDLLNIDHAANIRESLLRAIRMHFSDFFTIKMSDDEYKNRILRSGEGELPSLDTMVQGLRYYLSMMLSREFRRKLKRSDILDIMHLSYVNYVDYFRTDAYASQMAKRISQKNGARIVKFDEILEIL